MARTTNFVTLAEFRKLTGLSDSALVSLLSNNLVACAHDPERGLLIDLASTDTEQLMKGIMAEVSDRIKDEESLIIERYSWAIHEWFTRVWEKGVSAAIADFPDLTKKSPR